MHQPKASQPRKIHTARQNKRLASRPRMASWRWRTWIAFVLVQRLGLGGMTFTPRWVGSWIKRVMRHMGAPVSCWTASGVRSEPTARPSLASHHGRGVLVYWIGRGHRRTAGVRGLGRDKARASVPAVHFRQLAKLLQPSMQAFMKVGCCHQLNITVVAPGDHARGTSEIKK